MSNFFTRMVNDARSARRETNNNNNNETRRQRTSTAPRPAATTSNRQPNNTQQHGNNNHNNNSAQEPHHPNLVPRDLFSSFFGATRTQQQPNSFQYQYQANGFNYGFQSSSNPINQNTKTPPASRKALRMLPTVSVTGEDLVDENNRECCICFDEHQIHDKVTRLPCAHIYHPQCITEWLSRHCTCPVCRYELPTDDTQYEIQRIQRMSQRKPRYAKYELERMTMKDLLDLTKKINLSFDFCIEGGKKELISLILQSGKIDVISAPPPVEYENVTVLRNMGVGKLKRAMSDAGVFFDAKDVVEKEDMVQIFVNSGRIVFTLPNETNPDTEPGCVYGYPSSYTSSEKDYSCTMVQDDDINDPNSMKRPRVCDEDIQIDENSNVKDENDENENYHSSEDDTCNDQVNIDNYHKSDSDPIAAQHESDMDVCSEQCEEDRALPFQPISSNSDVKHNENSVHGGSDAMDTSYHNNSPSTEQHEYCHNDHDHDIPLDSTTTTTHNPSSSSSKFPNTHDVSAFLTKSVADLKKIAKEFKVDISDCIEKKEMVDRLSAVISSSR